MTPNSSIFPSARTVTVMTFTKMSPLRVRPWRRVHKKPRHVCVNASRTLSRAIGSGQLVKKTLRTVRCSQRASTEETCLRAFLNNQLQLQDGESQAFQLNRRTLGLKTKALLQTSEPGFQRTCTHGDFKTQDWQVRPGRRSSLLRLRALRALIMMAGELPRGLIASFRNLKVLKHHKTAIWCSRYFEHRREASEAESSSSHYMTSYGCVCCRVYTEMKQQPLYPDQPLSRGRQEMPS